MPPDRSSTVRSSDLPDWEFCALKFYYERVERRVPANPCARDASRREGTARHAAHDGRVAAATRLVRFSSAVSVVGGLILLLMLLLGLAACSATDLQETRGWLGALGAGLVMLALLLRRAAAEVRSSTRIPVHLRMLSSDAGPRRGQLLRDDRLCLVGRPDYVFTRRSGLRSRIFTAEVKPRPAPRRPFRGHVLQMAASIHLARAHYGRRAARTGFLIYADRSTEVELTPALSLELQDAVASVRALLAAPSPPPRNHASARRCAACPFASDCASSLI